MSFYLRYSDLKTGDRFRFVSNPYLGTPYAYGPVCTKGRRGWFKYYEAGKSTRMYRTGSGVAVTRTA